MQQIATHLGVAVFFFILTTGGGINVGAGLAASSVIMSPSTSSSFKFTSFCYKRQSHIENIKHMRIYM